MDEPMKLMDYCAWPFCWALVVVVVGLLFRHELRHAIERVRRLEFRGFSVEIEADFVGRDRDTTTSPESDADNRAVRKRFRSRL